MSYKIRYFAEVSDFIFHPQSEMTGKQLSTDLIYEIF